MTDEEVKSIMRSRGCCGEVFINKHGVKVTCVLTPEQHHAEIQRLREALEFYAIQNLALPFCDVTSAHKRKLVEDGGERARKALEDDQ